MLEYKIIDAKDKDADILTSIKLVTMIDDEMDKVFSYTEKEKIRKSVIKNVELTCIQYKMIYVGRKIAGAYLILPYDDGYIVDEIYLFKEFRNKGIGSSIINELKKDCRNLYIWVYKNNLDAIRLFQKLGFFILTKGRTMIMKCDYVYFNVVDKLNEIKLGYRDKEGNTYLGFKNNFRDIFYLQSPKQLLESKVGSCFDQVELERELINKMGVETRTYFITYPSDTWDVGYSFLIYKDTKKYYWLENAWVKYRGIHIYNNKEQLLQDVIKKFVATIPGGDIRKARLFMFDKPRFGINYNKYVTYYITGRGVKLK